MSKRDKTIDLVELVSRYDEDAHDSSIGAIILDFTHETMLNLLDSGDLRMSNAASFCIGYYLDFSPLNDKQMHLVSRTIERLPGMLERSRTAHEFQFCSLLISSLLLNLSKQAAREVRPLGIDDANTAVTLCLRPLLASFVAASETRFPDKASVLNHMLECILTILSMTANPRVKRTLLASAPVLSACFALVDENVVDFDLLAEFVSTSAACIDKAKSKVSESYAEKLLDFLFIQLQRHARLLNERGDDDDESRVEQTEVSNGTVDDATAFPLISIDELSRFGLNSRILFLSKAISKLMQNSIQATSINKIVTWMSEFMSNTRIGDVDIHFVSCFVSILSSCVMGRNIFSLRHTTQLKSLALNLIHYSSDRVNEVTSGQAEVDLMFPIVLELLNYVSEYLLQLVSVSQIEFASICIDFVFVVFSLLSYKWSRSGSLSNHHDALVDHSYSDCDFNKFLALVNALANLNCGLLLSRRENILLMARGSINLLSNMNGTQIQNCENKKLIETAQGIILIQYRLNAEELDSGSLIALKNKFFGTSQTNFGAQNHALFQLIN